MNDSEDIRAQLEELREAVRDYLRHPSEDGSPLRREKRRKLAKLVDQDKDDKVQGR